MSHRQRQRQRQRQPPRADDELPTGARIVLEFAPGDLVPEWLLRQHLELPNSMPRIIRFTHSGVVVQVRNMGFWVLHNVPIHSHLIDATTDGDSRVYAGEDQVSVPYQITIWPLERILQ